MADRTYGDKLRASNDEELAAFIAGEIMGLRDDGLEMSKKAWLAWLKKPVEES